MASIWNGSDDVLTSTPLGNACAMVTTSRMSPLDTSAWMDGRDMMNVWLPVPSTHVTLLHCSQERARPPQDAWSVGQALQPSCGLSVITLPYGHWKGTERRDTGGDRAEGQDEEADRGTVRQTVATSTSE